jgi:hypothetical protein
MEKFTAFACFALVKIALDTFKTKLHLSALNFSSNEPPHFVKAHPDDILKGADLYTIERIDGEVIITQLDTASIAYMYDEQGSSIYTFVVFLDSETVEDGETIETATGKKQIRIDRIYCLSNPNSLK